MITVVNGSSDAVNVALCWTLHCTSVLMLQIRHRVQQTERPFLPLDIPAFRELCLLYVRPNLLTADPSGRAV